MELAGVKNSLVSNLAGTLLKKSRYTLFNWHFIQVISGATV